MITILTIISVISLAGVLWLIDCVHNIYGHMLEMLQSINIALTAIKKIHDEAQEKK